MEENRNNDSHDLILEAVKSIDSIPTRDTDFHGDGTPPNSPAGFVSGPTWLSPADDPTDDPAKRGPFYWQSHSWMFRLPGELRIKIFRELLVTTKVYISFTNCRLLMAQRGAKLKQRATRGVSEFDEKHVEYYGVLGDDNDGERADVGTYFSPRRCHDDWNEYAMRNIALQSPAKFRDSYHPRPHLDIFLACRRARNEAEDIFYSENCFTFCTCNQVYDYNAAWDISAAHAAYCFFQDRSRTALKEIKHIELHVMHEEFVRGAPPNNHFTPYFWEQNIQMYHEMAMFIKSHMKIQRLTLNIGGWVPEEISYRGSGNYSLQTARHLEIEELLVLPPVKRLSILWTTRCFPLDVCNRHGSWCFANTKKPGCTLVSESLGASSFIKLIRDRLLPSGQKLGLSQIRGGLVLTQNDQQQYDSAHIVMETDDGCSDTSDLTARPVSHLTNDNAGPHNITSPRWPNHIACMEMVSNDFHESLRHSRYLVRPPRKDVTFHFVWIDSLTASNAIRALDCEDFWRNKVIRKELGLNIAAPPFATNTVRKGYEADPRNFINYKQWRDRLRHLLQLPRWTLQLVKISLLPRTVDQSELDASIFDTSDHQGKYSREPNKVVIVPDTPYQDLLRAVEDGEADQTIFFSCEPAWPCFVSRGDISSLWESDLHTDTVACIDRTTGLLLEY